MIQGAIMILEPLEPRIKYWIAQQSEIQAKRKAHKCTKVSTAEEKAQKAKTQESYGWELVRVQAILDTIEQLRDLERNF